MPEVTINYWAVLVAAISAMVIGALWYSPMLFANAWMKEVGKKMDDLKGGAQMGYALTMLLALFTAYVMAHFVDYTMATSVVDGALTGLWIALGFVATGFASTFVFEKRSFKLWAIVAGYQAVTLVVMGMILAGWQ